MGLTQELLDKFFQLMFCRRLNCIITKPFIFSLSLSLSLSPSHTHVQNNVLPLCFSFFLFSLQKANSCRVPDMETDNTGL